jgi:hypothetical protein
VTSSQDPDAGAIDGAIDGAILTAIDAVTDRLTYWSILLAEPGSFSVADPEQLRTNIARDEAAIDVLRWMQGHGTR